MNIIKQYIFSLKIVLAHKFCFILLVKNVQTYRGFLASYMKSERSVKTKFSENKAKQLSALAFARNKLKLKQN